MKIAIDARMYTESGVGRYIRNLTLQLQKLDQKSEYFILVLAKDKNIPTKNNFKKKVADFRWYGISEQIKLPKILNHIKPDLVHFPHFNVPLAYRGKFVVTIHDLIHQHFKMRRSTTHDPLTYWIKQQGYNQIFKNAISKAKKILVPSNFVKNQLMDQWKVRDGKIIVTQEAVEDNFSTIAGQMTQKMDNYIFYVGNAHPHKNVEGLIKAFLLLKKKYGTLKLVLSGYDHYFWQRIKKQYQHKDIIYTGYVSEEKLVTLYKNALLFVMPSFEEGFGIPLLEAMACGCSVVSSNAGALPEVGGDAAIYFNPVEPEDMVEKILQVLDSESLRKKLIVKGKERVKFFSWQKLAKQTLEVYRECV